MIARERVVVAADGTRVPLEVRDDLRPRRYAGRGCARRPDSHGAQRRWDSGQGCRSRRRGRSQLPDSPASTRRSTFPTIVFGSSFRNSTRAGTLYGASRSRQ